MKITPDDLIIRKKGTFFVGSQTYRLKEIKNLRMENRKFNFSDFLVSRSVLTSLKSFGCIVFDYKNRRVNFGGNLDDSKAKELLNILSSRMTNLGI